MRAQIASAFAPSEEASLLPGVLWIAFLGGGIMAIVVFGYRKRRKNLAATLNALDGDQRGTASIEMHDQAPETLSPAISLSLLPNGGLTINNKPVKQEFGNSEFELLQFLLWRFEVGRPYVASDEIESIFWPAEKNPDMSRKYRSALLKRLEAQLMSTLPKPDGSPWIISRNSPDDNRRREFRISPEPFICTTDFSLIRPEELPIHWR